MSRKGAQLTPAEQAQLDAARAARTPESFAKGQATRRRERIERGLMVGNPTVAELREIARVRARSESAPET